MVCTTKAVHSFRGSIDTCMTIGGMMNKRNRIFAFMMDDLGIFSFHCYSPSVAPADFFIGIHSRSFSQEHIQA